MKIRPVRAELFDAAGRMGWKDG